MDDQSQDCGQDAVPGTPVTVIVMNALYGVLGLLSSVYYYRPALRHYLRYITWMQQWVTPASSHKCGGGDHRCGHTEQVRGGSSILVANIPYTTAKTAAVQRKLSPLGLTKREEADRKPVLTCKQVR